MRLNLGIRRRLAPLMGNDRRKIELMHSLLFTLPGAPVLYYGDEIGMGDNITLPDRNGVRTPMQWSDEFNGGFSTAVPDSVYAPVINDPVYGYKSVNVTAQRDAEGSLLHTVRAMIQARKTLPMLANGSLEWLHDLPNEALCFWRVNGQGRFLALHNLSADALTIPLPYGLSFAQVFPQMEGVSQSEISLQPYGYVWLRPER
jgi:maltose alpha-D-glucosyltransferase/alpha-amylase